MTKEKDPYRKPTLTIQGSVRELTASVNVAGPGDNVFSVLLSANP